MRLNFIKNFSTFLIVALSLGLLQLSCSERASLDFFEDRGLNVTVSEPINRDFADIRNDGTLRMITRYSSNSYFLHHGIEWGFEYELVRNFAKEHDLALEVVIVGPEENPYDLLNSGKGDLIAANYTITPERDQVVDFSRPYNVVDQIVVYSSEIKNPPSTLSELAQSGIELTVRRNSSYYNRIKELQKRGYELEMNVVPDIHDTESVLSEISRGYYDATVADDNLFDASNKYMTGLRKGPVIAERDTIAWAIRENAKDFQTQLNRYLYKHFRFSDSGQEPKRSTFLNILRKRYFQEGKQIAEYYKPEEEKTTTGIISPYDDLIKSVADSAGIDWLLVASMVAQETRFNPNSKSWAGAVGLMQVMPRFSKVKDEAKLYNEKTNLREGVRIISEHLNHYSYLDSTNQWSFALATYNAGPGHVADARRLVIDQNKNPNKWEHTSEALLKLMQRKYYKDARHGFCRGIETVRYVKEIMNRYKTYQSILAMAERKQQRGGMGVIGMFN